MKSTLYEFANEIRNFFPSWSYQERFILEDWQWMSLVGFILIAFLVEKMINLVFKLLMNKALPALKLEPNEHLRNTTKPFGKVIFTIILIVGVKLIKLEASDFLVIERILIIALTINFVWLAHQIVSMSSYLFTQAAEKTETKFDDIIIPLLNKTAYVIVYLIGAIFIADSLTINVQALVAGLGIGGLAFAFAAKDTIANFFGSIMLVLDRPFDIGDYIVTGDLEGIVEEVGFRSTRIRTFYDSIITISNGELVNKAIDNKGKRRYRRLVTTLGLEYDTPVEKMEAFCEGIRQLILNHKWTRKDNFHVYFTNFGASSLDITMIVFWETGDYAREQAEKHRLMIDILRLAKELDVSFAFPTQTVHVFNDQPGPRTNLSERYFDDGIERAKKVLQKPFSLKNPRSNAQDEEQFGKNDIGV